MTFTIPRADWVRTDLVAERGEYAGFQMFSREANDAVAAMLHAILNDVEKSGASRAVVIAAVQQGVRNLARKHPEIHETEPEWAIVDAVNAFFATQGWVEIDNRDEVC
jgi:hypothetical protein